MLRVVQESSAIVTPGQQLLEVGDPADLEVAVDVLSSDAVKMVPEAKVILEHWGGDKPLQGRVRLVEPSGFMNARPWASRSSASTSSSIFSIRRRSASASATPIVWRRVS